MSFCFSSFATTHTSLTLKKMSCPSDWEERYPRGKRAGTKCKTIVCALRNLSTSLGIWGIQLTIRRCAAFISSCGVLLIWWQTASSNFAVSNMSRQLMKPKHWISSGLPFLDPSLHRPRPRQQGCQRPVLEAGNMETISAGAQTHLIACPTRLPEALHI